MAKKKLEADQQGLFIKPPAFKTLLFTIEGDSPYVQLRFSQKQKNKIKEQHSSGEKDAGTRKKMRERKDFDALFQEAMYEAEGEIRGLNAMSFKRAMVAACRLTDMPMKLAKLCFFVESDGADWYEGIPMVFFEKGEPHMLESICRNANKMPDLRVRAMWDPGWRAKLRIRYDADMISKDSVVNLLARAGSQVGIGEGRPDSSASDGVGMGWGTFKIVDVSEGD
jgi:hypothetical protein